MAPIPANAFISIIYQQSTFYLGIYSGYLETAGIEPGLVRKSLSPLLCSYLSDVYYKKLRIDLELLLAFRYSLFIFVIYIL
jgi:hypothetical protein